jgi:hypothetical protein
MSIVARAAAIVGVALVVGACTSRSTPASPSPSAAATVATSAEASASAVPTAFTSTTYGYALMVPAGWTTVQATAAWDGSGAPFSGDAVADQFIGPATASAWGFAAPTTEDLAGYVDERIAATATAASATCSPAPESQDPIDIGGEPGMLLSWNCGILINLAVTVHDGTGYVYGLRDPSVHAATDAEDRAIFEELLSSVQFSSE